VIVVDVGCHEHTHYPTDSIGHLVSRFKPDTFYGFDPYMGDDKTVDDNGTHYVLSTKLAWTHDGQVGFHLDPLWGPVSHVDTAGGTQMPCFDLARFIADLPEDTIVLKIDAEGAEYPLLHWLHEAGVDERLELVLVEWHRDERVELSCPVEEWP